MFKVKTVEDCSYYLAEELREYLQINKAEMSRLMGITKQTYNNYKRRNRFPKIRLLAITTYLIVNAKKDFDQRTDFLHEFNEKLL